MRRSRVVLLFSTEMRCFVAFSTRGVSAGSLRIPGSLLVTEETDRRQELIPAFLSPRKSAMPTIKARKQANGSTRYTAIVRIRRGTTVLHRESWTFTHRTAALSWAKHREVALENPGELARMRLSTPDDLERCPDSLPFRHYRKRCTAHQTLQGPNANDLWTSFGAEPRSRAVHAKRCTASDRSVWCQAYGFLWHCLAIAFGLNWVS